MEYCSTEQDLYSFFDEIHSKSLNIFGKIIYKKQREKLISHKTNCYSYNIEYHSHTLVHCRLFSQFIVRIIQKRNFTAHESILHRISVILFRYVDFVHKYVQNITKGKTLPFHLGIPTNNNAIHTGIVRYFLPFFSTCIEFTMKLDHACYLLFLFFFFYISFILLSAIPFRNARHASSVKIRFQDRLVGCVALFLSVSPISHNVSKNIVANLIVHKAQVIIISISCSFLYSLLLLVLILIFCVLREKKKKGEIR